MRVVTRRALTVVKSRVLHVSLKQCFFFFPFKFLWALFFEAGFGFLPAHSSAL